MYVFFCVSCSFFHTPAEVAEWSVHVRVRGVGWLTYFYSLGLGVRCVFVQFVVGVG